MPIDAARLIFQQNPQTKHFGLLGSRKIEFLIYLPQNLFIRSALPRTNNNLLAAAFPCQLDAFRNTFLINHQLRPVRLSFPPMQSISQRQLHAAFSKLMCKIRHRPIAFRTPCRISCLALTLLQRKQQCHIQHSLSKHRPCNVLYPLPRKFPLGQACRCT